MPRHYCLWCGNFYHSILCHEFTRTQPVDIAEATSHRLYDKSASNWFYYDQERQLAAIPEGESLLDHPEIRLGTMLALPQRSTHTRMPPLSPTSVWHQPVRHDISAIVAQIERQFAEAQATMQPS